MKRLITCASLAAVGAAALNAQPVGEPSASKPFSVSAKLRGFYDSNYNTAPSNPSPGYPIVKGESWGVDFAPSAQYNLLQDTTTFSVRYDADVMWFENRPDNRYNWYQVVDIGLSHNFSERYRIEFFDRFSYASEPEVTEPGVVTQFYQTDNNNFRNYGGIGFFGSFSESWGYHVGYDNTWYDYQQEGPGSLAALLNRIENNIVLDMRRMFDPTSTGMIGLRFLGTTMTGDDYLAPVYGPVTAFVTPKSDYRDSRQIFGFVGWDKEFSPQMSIALRGGVQSANYENADEDFITPYGDATLNYKYGEGSVANVGIKYSIYSSDVAMSPDYRGTVLGTKTMALYGGVIQRLTAKLSAHVRGQWQYMDYIGEGSYSGDVDNWFMADVGLTYTLNENLALDGGYLYDRLDSDIPNRAYSRNRAFFGIRATY